jgi:hypothetical protein
MLNQNSENKTRSEFFYAKESGLLSIKNENLFLALSVKGQCEFKMGFDDFRYYGMNILALKYKLHDMIPPPPLIPLSPQKTQPPYLCGLLPFFYLKGLIYTIPRYEHVRTYNDDKEVCIFADGIPVASVSKNFPRLFRRLFGYEWTPYYLRKLEKGRFYRTVLVLPREPIMIFVDIYDGRNMDVRISKKICNDFFFRSYSNNVTFSNNKICITQDIFKIWFENIYPPYEVRKLNTIKIGTSKGFAYILDDNHRIHQESGFITNIKAIYFEDNGSVMPKFHVDISSLQLRMKINTDLDDYDIHLDVKKKVIKKYNTDQ